MAAAPSIPAARREFREQDHSYWLNGQRVWSVTQILEESGVVDYSVIPPATRNMALKRGSAVHHLTYLDDMGGVDGMALVQTLERSGLMEPANALSGRVVNLGALVQSVAHMAELDDRGRLNEAKLSANLSPYLTVHRQLRAYRKAWRGFTETYEFVPDDGGLEERVWNDGRLYAGTLDARGRIRGGRRIIGDKKTNKAESWVRIQLAAYAGTFQDPRSYERVCIELHADGTHEAFFFPVVDWHHEFNEFLYLLEGLRIRAKYKGLKLR